MPPAVSFGQARRPAPTFGRHLLGQPYVVARRDNPCGYPLGGGPAAPCRGTPCGCPASQNNIEGEKANERNQNGSA